MTDPITLVLAASLVAATTFVVKPELLGAREQVKLKIIDGDDDVFGAGRVALRKLAFFELRHGQHDLPEEVALARIARQSLGGVPLLLNGGFDAASGESALREGHADAVVCGKPYIANSDLVERFRRGAALNELDFSTLYTPGAKGYTDYPALEPT